MSELSEALRRVAATATRHPSVAALRDALARRRGRRRSALTVLTTAGVLAGSATLVLRVSGENGGVVSAGGGTVPSTTAGGPMSSAYLGDGFCEPELTNAGFRIRPPGPSQVPAHTAEAAIAQARLYTDNASGTYSAYFAVVENPIGSQIGFDGAAARSMWVVEVRGLVPSPRSTDVHLRGGASNPAFSGRMVAFIDDATLTRAGAWAACGEGLTSTTNTTSGSVDVPNLTGIPADQASAVLHRLGLIVVRSDDQRSAGVQAGLVLSQTPLPGSRVLVGSQVILVVSAGP